MWTCFTQLSGNACDFVWHSRHSPSRLTGAHAVAAELEVFSLGSAGTTLDVSSVFEGKHGIFASFGGAELVPALVKEA
jgi:hypothetical protein